jgi:uncharacterized damage-inducible protein DinB
MAASAKQQFLENYDREHATTMRVLRAFPKEKADMRPHANLRTARELAWIFVMECGLGAKAWDDTFAKGVPSGTPPPPPKDWNDVIAAIEKATKDFRDLFASTPEAKLSENIHFMTGPKKLGEVSRMDFAWFLLNDQIHHRGQFSIYVRFTEARLPSIYGPTADEPWI